MGIIRNMAAIGKLETSGGGGDTIIVIETLDEEEERWVLDKTWNELNSLIETGKRVVKIANGFGNGKHIQEVAGLDYQNGVYYVTFIGAYLSLNPLDGVVSCYMYDCNDPDEYPGVDD